jgi:DNA-directed RNA polymerase subunit D
LSVEVREWSSEAIELYLEGFPLSLLNAIRRYSMAKVPTYAIDEVTIVVNTSAMFDEMLSHRLAMIPLRSEESINKLLSVDVTLCEKCSLDSEEKPSKDVCDKCFINMFLEAEAHDEEVTVYSDEIKSEDPYVKPVYGNIPIVILAPGQQISLELRARIGRGLEHAKWSPATVAITRNVAEIKIDKDLCNLCGKCVEICPKKVLNIDGGVIKVERVTDCIVCKQCVVICPTKAIDVVNLEDKNILRVESSGALEPETIIRLSLELLRRDLASLQDFIEKVKRGVKS